MSICHSDSRLNHLERSKGLSQHCSTEHWCVMYTGEAQQLSCNGSSAFFKSIFTKFKMCVWWNLYFKLFYRGRTPTFFGYTGPPSRQTFQHIYCIILSHRSTHFWSYDLGLKTLENAKLKIYFIVVVLKTYIILNTILVPLRCKAFR